MKTKVYVLFAVLFIGCAAMVGCAQKPTTANADQAIEQSKALATVEAQAQFLVKEANGFIATQNYDEAMKAANHVLSQLDANSADAKKAVEKAQAELTKLATAKADDLKKSLGGLGK